MGCVRVPLPAVSPLAPPLAGVVDDVGRVLDAIGSFFSSLASVHWGPLLLGLVLFGVYLTLRSRAYFHVLRAAYPSERIPFRRIWSAYVVSYGFNQVIPARGGDVVRLFLTKTSTPRASYPTVGSTFAVEQVFDLSIAIPVLTYAFTQGVFPKPPDFASVGAFDLSFLAADLRRTAFLLTVGAVLVLLAFALLSHRAIRFWARVRQGLTILRDRRRYVREVWLVQLAGWGFRFAAFWALLEAFGIGGSVNAVLLVLGVNAIAALLPFTPGGAGVQQAFLVTVFAGAAPAATVAAYSVGQQIAIAAFTLGVGFVVLVRVFGFRSFREVLRAGRENRDEETAGGAGTG